MPQVLSDFPLSLLFLFRLSLSVSVTLPAISEVWNQWERGLHNIAHINVTDGGPGQ
jgi:hypothetical protein